MNVLITGHTGFIGHNMYTYLEKKNVDVAGYSKSTGHDIFDTKNLSRFVKNSDLVYHFVAYAKPGRSVIEPTNAIKINVDSCLNILEACRKYDVPLIYPSSCEIYGNSKIPIREDFELKPTNPYAASKAAADRICYSYFETYGMNIKIVRLFNPYGPGQQLNKICPVFYSQAVRNQDISVFGDGGDTRDYVYISDIIEGLWLARKLKPGETINLSTEIKTTTFEMAKLILKLTGSESKIKFVEYPKEFGNIKNQVGSFEKAKKLIGWESTVRLPDGIIKTIEWLRGVSKNE